MSRPGKREHTVKLDVPHEGIKYAVIGYMAGATDSVYDEVVDLDCEVTQVGPSSLFVTATY